MKLKTLAIAVAMASLPMTASAEKGEPVFKFTGDIGVALVQDSAGNTTLNERGSEINIDASQKINGITFMGHTEIELNGSGDSVIVGNPTDPDGAALSEFQVGSASTDEIRVGATGGFGTVWLGDTDNGCNTQDIGGTNEIFFTHSQGGCQGASEDNISYQRGFGSGSVGISFNPGDSFDETTGDGEDEVFAIGGKFKLGKHGVSLGYEDGDGLGGSNVVVGLTSGIGPFSVGFRGNTLDSDTAGTPDLTTWGVNFLYSRNDLNFYGGLGTTEFVNTTGGVDEKDSYSLGVLKAVGNTDFIFEIADLEGDEDSSVALAMRHRF